MRELKYRVYDKVEKCYSDKAFSIDQFGDCYVQDEDGYWEEIDKERYAIERCTGLKDKNEKYIYEGDIVSTSSVGTWQIEERRGCFWVGKYALYGQNDYCEVIGNIHENPELLGGKE